MTSTLAPTGETTPHTPTANDETVTEAILVCCALAWQGNPMVGLDLSPGRVDAMVRRARNHHSITELLQWRTQHEPGTWDLRWRWARRVARIMYGYALGIEHVPLHHHEVPEPETTATAG